MSATRFRRRQAWLRTRKTCAQMGSRMLLASPVFYLLQGNNIGDKIIPDFECPLGKNVCVTDDMEDRSLS
jgi:hypothetical protein